MKTLKFAAIAISLAAAETALAGGLLTNTNQNVAFLRNPARGAAIGIDGVYSNPAGVAFLGDGLHLSINLQNAHQTRTVTTGFPLFVYNANTPGQTSRKFEGKADAPVIPSLQAAWNKGKWSLQFGFAITGGGGKCEFDGGLGSFEQVVASIPVLAQDLNAVFPVTGMIPSTSPSPIATEQVGNGYSYDSYMRGRQYYYGFTLGAARKLTDNISVYGGLRMLYGTSNYYGYVRNIKVESAQQGIVAAPQYFGKVQQALAQYSGAAAAAGAQAAAEVLAKGAAGAGQLAAITQDIELNCDQTGWGIAPIIGVDYKAGRLNLAAKYEFKTRMRLKNKSANSASAKNIEMLNKYADGNKVAEDSPALLTVGAQYEITNDLRVMAGWHHYFDVDTKQYTKDMLSDSNEYLFGAEYDICDIVQVSAGAQRTVYGMKDAGMNDISFNVSSWSFGLGVGVKVSEKVKLNAAYFQTLYDDYNKTEAVVTNSFTRTNRVLGLGVDLKL
ncbi:MAG: transporter [Prevotella sp.]|nr:transporter [Prevotella sp.]